MTSRQAGPSAMIPAILWRPTRRRSFGSMTGHVSCPIPTCGDATARAENRSFLAYCIRPSSPVQWARTRGHAKGA